MRCRADEPPWLPHRRAAPPTRRRRSGTSSATSPTCRRRGDRPVRPQLVQPGRGGKRHGLLHPGGVPRVPAPCPEFERMLVDAGHPADQVLVLRQRRGAGTALPRAGRRPRPALEAERMDLQSREKWVEYSRAKDEMFKHTDMPEAPWYTVEADDKRRARLNCIAHILSGALRGSHREASAKASAPAVGGRLPPPSGRLADVRPRSRRPVSRAELSPG